MIETLQDLNYQACCCDLPLCPLPMLECESNRSVQSAKMDGEPSDSDQAKGEYAQYTEPAGADGDPLPAIYRLIKETTEWTPHDPKITGHLTYGYNYHAHGSYWCGGEWREIVTYDEYLNRAYTWDAGGFGPVTLTETHHIDYYRNAGNVCIADPGRAPLHTVTVYPHAAPPDLHGLITITEPIVINTTLTKVTRTGEKNHEFRLDTLMEGGIEWFYDIDLTTEYPDRSYELSNPITRPELVDLALAGYGSWSGTSRCFASFEDHWITIGELRARHFWPVTAQTTNEIGYYIFGGGYVNDSFIALTKLRVRFRIPSDVFAPFTGTFFKITFDVLFTPKGWTSGAGRTYLADQVLTWAGPGNLAHPTDDSWVTAWYEIAAPPEPGTREIVNIRFVCREGWYIGDLPQVTGTAVDLSGDTAE